MSTCLNRTFRAVVSVTLLIFPAIAQSSECETLRVPEDQLIWCDDFEDSDLPQSGLVADNYHDYTDDGGRLERVNFEAKNGEYSLRQAYRTAGEQSAGYFFRTFGRSPVSSQSHSSEDIREVYWRLYVMHPDDFIDFPDKLTRATVFASPNRAQAMIAHVWLEESQRQVWMLDPASGTDEAGILKSTQWNDFANIRYLGQQHSTTPVARGQWQCVEIRVALNSAGNEDGIFQMWIDDQLVAESQTLNWLGSYDDFGINAVSIESYWNSGSPTGQSRYIDSLVIAKQRIGCTNSKRPAKITQLTVQ